MVDHSKRPRWLEYLPNWIRERIEGYEGRYSILQNTLWLSAESILRMGAGFFIGVWVARYLGPTAWGLFNYSLAYFVLFMPLIGLGLHSIVIRDIVQGKRKNSVTLGTSFLIKIIAAVVALVLADVLIVFLQPRGSSAILFVWVLSVGFLFKPLEVVDYWFQSQVQSKYPAISRTVVFLIGSLIKVVLLLRGAPLITFILVSLFDFAFSFLGLVVVYKLRGFSLRKWHFEQSVVGALLKESWPLFLTALSLVVIAQINKVMVGQLLGNSAVGVYSAASKISELFTFIPIAVAISVMPFILSYGKDTGENYHRRLQWIFNFMSIFSISIAVIVTIFSDVIIDLIFGDSYQSASIVLSVEIWTLLFISWGLAQSSWDVNEGFLTQRLVRTLVGSLILILLNLALIPRIGVLGAALSAVVATSITHAFGNLFFTETRPIFATELRSMFPFYRPGS